MSLSDTGTWNRHSAFLDSNYSGQQKKFPKGKIAARQADKFPKR